MDDAGKPKGDVLGDTMLGTSPSSSEDKSLGELVAGRYRIVRWIGGGGMGSVYEAFDTELGERVALKVLKGALGNESLERFRREVRLTRRIQHRNVARMFDIGEHAGDKFLTMELVEGKPLSCGLFSPSGDGPTRPTWSELRDLVLQICEGLAAAHSTGVVHRDLKPDNVLVETATKRAVITDFGIARGGDEVNMTQVGAIIGTPRYMAPEQLAGGAIDHRADLFSLGVMLYELSAGTLPWSGDTAVAIAIAQATQPPRPWSSRTMPASLGDVVARCIALDPLVRFGSANELAAALSAIVDEPQSPRSARPTTPPSRPTPWPTPSSNSSPPSRLAAETTIAVLPFDRFAPDDRYLAEGLREDVVDTLSVTAGLRVLPTSSTLEARDPRDIGRELGVDHVVTGTLQRTPAGLRVAARLFGVVDGFQIWAHKSVCTEAEVLAVSDTIARGVADALSTRPAPPAKPIDPRAVDLYLRAREELRRFWGPHAQNAARFLDDAARISPDSAQILGARAYAHVHAWVRTNTPESFQSARDAVDQALATGSGEAFLASGILNINMGDVEGAARDYAIALARAPMSASVHEHVGRLMSEIDPEDSGRRHFQTALQLDGAREMIIAGDLARLAALERNWDEVDQRLALIRNHADPSIATSGQLYTTRFAIWKGDIETAVREQTAMVSRMNPTGRELFTLLSDTLHGKALDVARWTELLHKLPLNVASSRTRLIIAQRMCEFAAGIDQIDAAAEAMEFAAQMGLIDIHWVDRCAALDKLRALPRWSTLRAPTIERAARVLAVFRAATA